MTSPGNDESNLVSKAGMQALSAGNDVGIKYCAVAFIDLLGFASHLEVGTDLRTNVGREAVKRLQALDGVLELVASEINRYPAFCPLRLFHTRINDALIFSLDLSDALLPDIGDTSRQAMTTAQWEKYFEFSSIPEEKFDEEYSARLKKYTRPVEQFVGLIARIHHQILVTERQAHFPGVKSVISSGFRRVFFSNSREDVLSANFAFSNAYLAEHALSGPHLFIDNNILQLLTADTLTRTILKLSCFAYQQNVFSPFDEGDEALSLGGKYLETEPIGIKLLRKQYYFRRVNHVPLTYLQLVDEISRALNDPEITKRRVLKELADPKIEERVRAGTSLLSLKLQFGLIEDIEAFLYYLGIGSENTSEDQTAVK